MNFCKTQFIPCPCVLTEWTELPCCGTQAQCNEWKNRWNTLNWQDANGKEFKPDPAKVMLIAKRLFDSGKTVVTIQDVYEILLSGKNEV